MPKRYGDIMQTGQDAAVDLEIVSCNLVTAYRFVSSTRAVPARCKVLPHPYL